MFSWQTGLIVLLITTHYRLMATTVYLHRGMAHGLFKFNPGLAHIFRFWLWASGQLIWKDWAQHWCAQHRKHHKYSDRRGDPHSPHQVTFKQLLFDFKKHDSPYFLTDKEVQFYAPDVSTPDDWIERNLYRKYPDLGRMIHAILFAVFFGWFGVVWGIILYFYIQPLGSLITAWAHHKIGFRYAAHSVTNDHSRLVCPFGLFQAGEVLHANHHAEPSNPTFSHHWWELDPGWWYIRFFIAVGLMSLVNKDT
jgi:stearoyl-CoA desaturase (delta-9 desaturase)